MQPNKTTWLLALSLASLGTPAAAQETPPDLSRARAAFASADADRSGGLSLAEAATAGHTQTDFRGFDLDGDGALTQSEFIVGYKERMAAGGRRVAPDLENEARRILTERRAAQAEEARRRESADAEGPAARRSDALREKIRSSGADPLRVRSQAAGKSAAGEGNAADPKSRATDALRELQGRRNAAGAPPAGPDRPAPDAGTPAAGNATPPNARGAGNDGNAGRPDAGAKEQPGPNARPAAPQGPGARRLGSEERLSPEELQRLFRQRRERAAEASKDDPRARAERERAEERAAEKANGSSSSGSSAGSPERGRTTGTGGGGNSSSRGAARPASGRPRGGGF